MPIVLLYMGTAEILAIIIEYLTIFPVAAYSVIVHVVKGRQ